jgi:hypothetical protein
MYAATRVVRHEDMHNDASRKIEDPFAAGGKALWTVGMAIVAFQIVVVVGFALTGLSLALRPTA